MKLEFSGVFIAFALIWFLGLSGGSALNSIVKGIGDQLIQGAWLAFVVLVILGFIAVFKK